MVALGHFSGVLSLHGQHFVSELFDLLFECCNALLLGLMVIIQLVGAHEVDARLHPVNNFLKVLVVFAAFNMVLCVLRVNTLLFEVAAVNFLRLPPQHRVEQEEVEQQERQT